AGGALANRILSAEITVMQRSADDQYAKGNGDALSRKTYPVKGHAHYQHDARQPCDGIGITAAEFFGKIAGNEGTKGCSKPQRHRYFQSHVRNRHFVDALEKRDLKVADPVADKGDKSGCD